MKDKTITIKDVAKIAGVSVSTVSRALNNYSDINQETKEKIFSVVKELGYKPNNIARSLSSSRTFRLGMLVEDNEGTGRLNPLVLEMIIGFKNTSSKLGYETVLLSTTSDIQRNEKLQKIFKEKQLDGMFIMGLKMTDQYYDELSNIDKPCVLLDVNINNPNVACIGVDNVRGSFLAVEHLIKSGHKKIGFINGHKDAYVSYERLDGYFLAHSRYKLPVDNSLIENADFTDEGAQEAVKRLLQRHKDITAIFCASDLMATGAIYSLTNCGYSVPEDISVVGFDDIHLAECIVPRLTTIRQDAKKIGTSAASLLVNLVQGQHMGRIVIEPELIVRESTKRI
ncbi:transcriptional regulator, LacI family [Alkalithermobacter thermoalcaliphilus JW-YL-7 = DSM 7308]|uniref:Transcriptional regulator, LacI family n=1 Tax=Alkalithermobacter thermoalcaliphilus JW-YL-7 = DSM 7308 TaxID=1121328 RepID=A0A150FNT7_CLOPD|nr:transcriptional regulator, LacI family [[Clostridium] paradoxum JW-YL-7 = DSM 7308]SHK85819.1 transcriptional regulator, LacI family [[Clostridium] paradoxum JW-YL-7 = DSM 7308]